MKVMLINGSPHPQGNTFLALEEMRKIFAAEDIETEMVHVGNKALRGCIACGSCAVKKQCVFDDLVNETAPIFKESDGIVIGSPVYYASANGTLISYLDRLFFSTQMGQCFDKTMKVGASVVIARRGGLSATFDELNKYFTMNNMPVWNSAHGREQGEVIKDDEGMQTMRTLARNMVFLMKSIALGKEKYGLPEKEEWIPTHFIR